MFKKLLNSPIEEYEYSQNVKERIMQLEQALTLLANYKNKMIEDSTNTIIQEFERKSTPILKELQELRGIK